MCHVHLAETVFESESSDNEDFPSSCWPVLWRSTQVVWFS